MQINYIKENLGDGFNLIFPKDYSEEGIFEHIEEADVLVGNYITAPMLVNGNIKIDSSARSWYSLNICLK